MVGHDIIVIGASAGGIQILQELVSGLPANLPASLFIVVHTAPSSSGLLPQILGRRSKLKVEYAVDERPIEHGKIYVAPPDHHLLIKPRHLCVVRGPKENGFRPAVDPLFRTAAKAYGARVVGIILSGGLDDGTLGLTQVKQSGGIAIVQDPDEAPFSSMPESAIRNADVDYVLNVADIAPVLTRLAEEPVPKGAELMSRKNDVERDIAEIGTESLTTNEMPGTPSGFTCPECGGALWELRGGKLLRFRCHVGHSYTAETFMAEQSNGVEAALWIALRALEESAALRRRMADRAEQGNLQSMVQQYRQQAEEAEARAGVIRKVLVSEPGEAMTMKQSRPQKNGSRKLSARRSSHGKSNNRSSTSRHKLTHG